MTLFSRAGKRMNFRMHFLGIFTDFGLPGEPQNGAKSEKIVVGRHLFFGPPFLHRFFADLGRFLKIFGVLADALPVRFASRAAKSVRSNFAVTRRCDIAQYTVNYNTKSTFSRLRRFCGFCGNLIFSALSPSRCIEKTTKFRAAPQSSSGLDFAWIWDAFWVTFRTKIPPKCVPEGNPKKRQFRVPVFHDFS